MDASCLFPLYSCMSSGMIRKAAAILFLLGLLIPACKEHPYSQGEVLYGYHCAPCHMDDGSGLAQLIPPLTKASLGFSQPERLVCLIRNGIPVNPATGQQMLPNKALSDTEMTNLINFLGIKYAALPQTVQVQDVKKMLAGCQTR